MYERSDTFADVYAEIVDRLYPEHAGRIAETFAALDDVEKRQLAKICLKLAA